MKTTHILQPRASVMPSRPFRGASLLMVGAVACLSFLASAKPAMAADESGPCIAEPTDQMIAYGDVLAGTDCTLSPAGDNDVFRFSGSAGETVRVRVSRFSGGIPCVELFDPSATRIAGPSCSTPSAGFDVTLAATGVFAIFVSELNNDSVMPYAVTLERLAPPSSASVPLFFGNVLSDAIDPISDQDLYYFSGTVGNTIRVTVTRTAGGIPCLEVFDPAGSRIAGVSCSTPSVQADVPLGASGVFTIVVSELNHDANMDYNVSLECIGICPPPTCTLEMGLSYDAGLQRLTIDWQVQTDQPVDWNAWFTYLNQSLQLWSAPIPAINPAVSGPVSFTIPPLGTVGMLSTFSTSGAGIVCSDFETVNTGAPSLGAATTRSEIESNLPTSPGNIGGNPGRGNGNGQGRR